MKIYAPWERGFLRVSAPFERFIKKQSTTGIILLFATIAALILANSPLKEWYDGFFHTDLGVSFGSFSMKHSLHHWINDALMAIFFFIIGLEVKKEFISGELSDLKVAMLPIVAALGGMIVPALIFSFFNFNQDSIRGWGIPMATDIAFAISILMLLKGRISTSLVTFLIALAIVDDLGAVVVIALFYTSELHFSFLALAFAMFLVMVLLNRLGVHNTLAYFFVGVAMWYFMHESGVHATIAGVIASLSIPTKPKYDPVQVTEFLKKLLDDFNSSKDDNDISDRQKEILHDVKKHTNATLSPSARLEHSLNLPVGLLVIPLFAFANAGISIDFSHIGEALIHPVALGVIFGLIVGKTIGISLFSLIAIKLGLASMPSKATVAQLFGVSILGGIGFTMSMFISELAFAQNPEFIFEAKVSILIASISAGILGYSYLRVISRT